MECLGAVFARWSRGGRLSKVSVRVLVVGACVVAGVCCVVPGVALGVQVYSYEVSFGGRGAEAGQLVLAAPISVERLGTVDAVPEFGTAGSGVAVNSETGVVYVADTGNRRIDEFDPAKSGAERFVGGFGAKVGPLGEDTCTRASGCVRGSVGAVPGELPAELEAPRFVAVDNASGASHGDVYVGSGVGRRAQNMAEFVEISTPSKGSFTLSVEGETTAPISYSSEGYDARERHAGPNATAIREALEALSKIGDGNVLVIEQADASGSAARGVLVEFIGGLKEKPVGILGCDAAGLAPAGSECDVSVVKEGSGPVAEVVDKFSATGVLEEAWSVKGRLESKQAPAEDFSGLAVDSTGHLWLYDGRTAYEFGESAALVRSVVLGSSNGSASGLAVDGAGDLYAVDAVGQKCVERYTSEGESPACVSAARTTGMTDPSGFALGSGAGVFADLGGSVELAEPGCLVLGSCGVFGSGLPAGGSLEEAAGVAFDSADQRVFVASAGVDEVAEYTVVLEAETTGAEGVGARAATLTGEVDPHGGTVSRCSFQYGLSAAYEADAACIDDENGEVVSQQHPLTGIAAVHVHALVRGLAAGSVYHFRVHALNETGIDVVGHDEAFPTLVAAVIDGEAAVVQGGVVTLSADVNPEGVAGTSCTIEYGLSTAYEESVACEASQPLSGSSPVAVSAHVGGVAAGVTYHWRVVVADANTVGGEAVASGDGTFVELAGGPSGPEECPNEQLRGESDEDEKTRVALSRELPDCRAYELVTPVRKNAAYVGGRIIESPPPSLSADGGRLIAVADQCFAQAVSCTAGRKTIAEPFAFEREEGGWAARSLEPPAAVYGAPGAWAYSAQTGEVLFSAPVPGQSGDSFYASGPGGVVEEIGPISEGLSFEHGLGLSSPFLTTADLQHVVFNYLSVQGLWPRLTAAESPIFEYFGRAGREPFLVNVEKEGRVLGGCGAELAGAQTNGQEQALSADGRVVFFNVDCGGALYARVGGGEAGARTVLVSGRSPGGCSGECLLAPDSSAHMEGAAEDGSRVLFTSTQRLTNEASEDEQDTAGKGACASATHAGGCNLYMFEVEGEHLVDVSAGDLSGFGPRVQGVVAVSGDGTHVYLVAQGVLAGANREGKGPVEGADNLYLYERDSSDPGGRMVFVATLPGNAAPEPEEWKGRSATAANVSPDGGVLVFTSHGALTGDDTRGIGPEQVYRYDAGEEQLVRVSIGERGFADDGLAGTGNALIANADHVNGGVGQPRRDPSMSDDGSLIFFQSPVGLTPRALNDVPVNQLGGGTDLAQNIYEWEADGTQVDSKAACGEAAGCIRLISDGEDVSEGNGETTATESSVELLGADVSGDDVFFTTADRLVPADSDSELDYYDARVNGGFPAPVEPVCHGEETCLGAPSSPGAVGGVGSEAPGSGNLIETPSVIPPLSGSSGKPKPLTRAQLLVRALRACHKDRRRARRVACERGAHRRYGPVHKHKAAKRKG
jgi:hypothetical protein